jgi:hypothetical protein
MIDLAFYERHTREDLAGRIAAELCTEGSEPGWKRSRSNFEKTAFHEAGHCVLARINGRHPFKAEANETCGQVTFSEKSIQYGSISDKEMISFNVEYVAQNGLSLDLEKLEQETVQLLRDHWQWVKRIAHSLIFKRILERDEIDGLLSDMPEGAALC